MLKRRFKYPLAAQQMVLIFSFAWLPFCALAAEPAIPPRMWEVNGAFPGGQSAHFFLLGISHSGLSVEYDDYLESRVIPALKKSTIFAYENANLVSESAPECANELKDSSSLQTVSAARMRLVELIEQFNLKSETNPADKMPANFSWKPYATSVADSYSEFGLYLQLQIAKAELAAFRASDAPSAMPAGNYGAGVPITTALAAKFPNIERASLDTQNETVDAYCRMGDARVELLRVELGLPSRMPIGPIMEEAGSDFLKVFAEQRVFGRFRNFPEFDNSFVCGRNENWLKKMALNADQGTIFYAVGAAHLFPVVHSDVYCKGLLGDLRALGLKVDALH